MLPCCWTMMGWPVAAADAAPRQADCRRHRPAARSRHGIEEKNTARPISIDRRLSNLRRRRMTRSGLEIRGMHRTIESDEGLLFLPPMLMLMLMLMLMPQCSRLPHRVCCAVRCVSQRPSTGTLCISPPLPGRRVSLRSESHVRCRTSRTPNSSRNHERG